MKTCLYCGAEHSKRSKFCQRNCGTMYWRRENQEKYNDYQREYQREYARRKRAEAKKAVSDLEEEKVHNNSRTS